MHSVLGAFFQVGISAEEKRGILKLQKEERERREAILRDEFGELVREKLKGAGAATDGP